MKFKFNFNFFYSSPNLRNKRENGWISVIKGESFDWIQFRPWKLVISVLMIFFTGRVYSRCFFSLKLTEIVDMNPKIILISGEAINIFFKVFGMFVF